MPSHMYFYEKVRSPQSQCSKATHSLFLKYSQCALNLLNLIYDSRTKQGAVRTIPTLSAARIVGYCGRIPTRYHLDKFVSCLRTQTNNTHPRNPSDPSNTHLHALHITAALGCH